MITSEGVFWCIDQKHRPFRPRWCPPPTLMPLAIPLEVMETHVMCLMPRWQKLGTLFIGSSWGHLLKKSVAPTAIHVWSRGESREGWVASELWSSVMVSWNDNPGAPATLLSQPSLPHHWIPSSSCPLLALDVPGGPTWSCWSCHFFLVNCKRRHRNVLSHSMGGRSKFLPDSCSFLSVSNTAFHLLDSFQTQQMNFTRLFYPKSWAYWASTIWGHFLQGVAHRGVVSAFLVIRSGF